jgi:diguanylate cyclase (GGDEF)-like protein
MLAREMDAALSHRGAVYCAALASYALISGAYLMFELPGLGIGHFFYLPIALVALVSGTLVGAGGGLLATLLYVGCVFLNDRIPSTDVLTAATFIRAVTFITAGALIGTFAARNRALVERLRELADRDYLTGLLNTRAFEAELQRRCVGGRRFAILLADLDELKETNDREGHAAGNALLRIAATGLEATVRDGDLVARVGGDEFGVLSDAVTPEDATALAKRIEGELEEAGVAVSVGWAIFPIDGATSMSLYRRADERLYASKHVRKARAQVVALLRPAAS